MALAVLIFHYDKWLTGVWNATSLQGKLGVYAVSVFFVLSGLTLTLVYEGRLDLRIQTWGEFFRKRIFRIYPLLWLATAATLLLEESQRSGEILFLNFTGLFGFFNAAKDIATGAWSIGCELVFYAAFPALLLLSKFSRPGFLLVFGGLLALAVWIAFASFSPEKSLQSEWWEIYVQAPNHVFFFAGGMAIGIFRAYLSKIPRSIWLGLLVSVVLLFVFWPIESEPYHLVSGWNRVFYSGITLLLVTAFFNSNIIFKGLTHQCLSWLGAVSYSLYLLHPLVFRVIRFVTGRLGWTDGYWQIILPSVIATLFLSHVSYYYFEKPLARKG
jgi:peptidoglycan/LPS O-acetylase OafA/YrhL